MGEWSNGITELKWVSRHRCMIIYETRSPPDRGLDTAVNPELGAPMNLKKEMTAYLFKPSASPHASRHGGQNDHVGWSLIS